MKNDELKTPGAGREVLLFILLIHHSQFFNYSFSTKNAMAVRRASSPLSAMGKDRSGILRQTPFSCT